MRENVVVLFSEMSKIISDNKFDFTEQVSQDEAAYFISIEIRGKNEMTIIGEYLVFRMGFNAIIEWSTTTKKNFQNRS